MENLHVNAVEIVCLSQDATIPVQVNDSQAGWDLHNNANTEYLVWKGMRIAQLIIEKYQICCLKVVNKLPETSRGARGFGSS